jgi:flap endonuclease-1
MGIKDLNAFLLKQTTKSIINGSLRSLSDKKVAIDTSIFLYKFKYKSDNIIPKFFEQINRLRLNKITPIYIFDGKPPIEKQDILQKRKEKKRENKFKIEVLKNKLLEIPPENNEYSGLKDQLTKCETKNISVTYKDIIELKQFLDLSNIQYIQSDGEADLVCSKLCEIGKVDMVLSEDMDILTSHAGILLRNFNINSNNIIIYNLESILKELGLSYEDWVRLCILFGCDYLKRIHSVGPVYSYNLIKRLCSDNSSDNSSDNIVQELLKKKNVKIPENYIEKFEKAYSIFTDYNLKNSNNIEVKDKIILDNKVALTHFLLEKTGLSIKKINNRINNIYY